MRVLEQMYLHTMILTAMMKDENWVWQPNLTMTWGRRYHPLREG